MLSQPFRQCRVGMGISDQASQRTVLVIRSSQYSSPDYRFGFNGKENDNDVKGIEGTQQDYGFRIYDPRTGKFLSIDPLQRKYPHESPYLYCGANPILYLDPDGKQKYVTHILIDERTGEKVVLKLPVPGDNSLLGKTNSFLIPDASGKVFNVKYTDWYDINEVFTTVIKKDGSIAQTRTVQADALRITTKLFIKKQWYANLLLGEIGQDKGKGGGVVFSAPYGRGEETRTTTRKVQAEDLGLLLDALGGLTTAQDIKTLMQEVKEVVEQKTTFEKFTKIVEATMQLGVSADLVHSAKEQITPEKENKGNSGILQPVNYDTKGQKLKNTKGMVNSGSHTSADHRAIPDTNFWENPNKPKN